MSGIWALALIGIPCHFLKMPFFAALSSLIGVKFPHALVVETFHYRHDVFTRDIAMSIHPRMYEFGPVPSFRPVKLSFRQRLAAYLRLVFSGAKGEQGGWESGARGM